MDYNYSATYVGCACRFLSLCLCGHGHSTTKSQYVYEMDNMMDTRLLDAVRVQEMKWKGDRASVLIGCYSQEETERIIVQAS